MLVIIILKNYNYYYYYYHYYYSSVSTLHESEPASQIHVELRHCPRPLQAGWPGQTIEISSSMIIVMLTEKMLSTSTELLNVWIASSTVWLSDWATFQRHNSTKLDSTPTTTAFDWSVSCAKYVTEQNVSVSISVHFLFRLSAKAEVMQFIGHSVCSIQDCHGYEISHPYPYPQIVRGYPQIYPYAQMLILCKRVYTKQLQSTVGF